MLFKDKEVYRNNGLEKRAKFIFVCGALFGVSACFVMHGVMELISSL